MSTTTNAALELLVLDRLAELEGLPFSRRYFVSLAWRHDVPTVAICQVLTLDAATCRTVLGTDETRN